MKENEALNSLFKSGLLLLFQSPWLLFSQEPDVLISPFRCTSAVFAVFLLWCGIRGEASPLHWFIYVSCLLCARRSDSAWASAPLESGCSFWVNYAVASVYQRDLLTGKCNYFFPVVCDSCQLRFWPVHCFLKSSSLQPRLLFCSRAALTCMMLVSVISSVVFLASLWSDDALHHHVSVDHDRSSYPWAKPKWSQSNGQCSSIHPPSKPGSLWAFPWEYLMGQSG